MKKFMLTLIMAAATIMVMPLMASAQEEKKEACDTTEKTLSFRVEGQCGMCEKRIEKAAKDLEGVTSADWIIESKELTVKYHPNKVKEDKIHEAIAMVGHTTSKKEASAEAYEKLPACCKYKEK
jgi:copper chaperone CopZ